MSDEADLPTANRGYALRFLREAEGWKGPAGPIAGYASAFDADQGALVRMIEEVRQDERRRVGRRLTKEANRIFQDQTDKDYPGNVLDRVALHLNAGEPLEVRPEKYRKPEELERDRAIERG